MLKPLPFLRVYCAVYFALVVSAPLVLRRLVCVFFNLNCQVADRRQHFASYQQGRSDVHGKNKIYKKNRL